MKLKSKCFLLNITLFGDNENYFLEILSHSSTSWHKIRRELSKIINYNGKRISNIYILQGLWDKY